MATPLPSTARPVIAPRRSTFAALKRKHSAFTAIPAHDNTRISNDIVDDEVHEARDTPTLKLQRRRSTAQQVLRSTVASRRLYRRYSAGEQRASNSTEQQQRARQLKSTASTADVSADTHAATELIHKRKLSNGTKASMMELLQSNLVTKRLSLLPTSSASFFAAAIAAAANAKAKEAAHDNAAQQQQQYEEMMERFQIRRLQHTSSSSSLTGANVASGTNTPHTSSRSGKVVPVDPDSVYTARLTRTSSYQASLAPAAEGHEQPQQSTTHVIKARNSAHHSHHETTNTPANKHQRLSLHWLLVSWRRKCRRTLLCWRQTLATPLSPFSIAGRVRAAILVLAYITHAICFPIDAAFYDDTTDTFDRLDHVTEVVFMLDVVVSFNESYVDKRGVLVTSRRAIARHYVRSWCVPDLLAAVPTSLLVDVLHRRDSAHHTHNAAVTWVHVFCNSVVRMTRLVHIVRLVRLLWLAHASRAGGKSIWAWLTYSRYAHLVHIAWLVLLLVLVAHYMACCWKLLEEPTSRRRAWPIAEQYAANFYDALQLLQGQGLATSTLRQHAFASFAVLLGSAMLAIVFGHVAMLVANFSANATTYQRKMEAVFAMTSKLQLPTTLCERIHQYYEHLWREYESLDGELEHFAASLTHNLALEVTLFKYMDLVLNVPFWRECSPDFLKHLVLRLRVRVYLPDDFVLRRGEVSDEFYMLNRGSVELVTGHDSIEQATRALPLRRTDANTNTNASAPRGSESTNYVKAAYYSTQSQTSSTRRNDKDELDSVDKRSRGRSDRGDRQSTGRRQRRVSVAAAAAAKHTRLLTRGQAFGELALLWNYQRTANARAVTYVEMCVLSRSDFQAIIARHPSDRKLALANIFTLYMTSNDRRHVACPLKQAVARVFDGDHGTDQQPPITAQVVASILTAVANPPQENDDDATRATNTFGMDVNFVHELTKLRVNDRTTNVRVLASSDRASMTTTSSKDSDGAMAREASSTDVSDVDELDARIERIERSQTQTLRIMHEMRAAMTDVQRLTPHTSTASAAAAAAAVATRPDAGVYPLRMRPTLREDGVAAKTENASVDANSICSYDQSVERTTHYPSIPALTLPDANGSSTTLSQSLERDLPKTNTSIRTDSSLNGSIHQDAKSTVKPPSMVPTTTTVVAPQSRTQTLDGKTAGAALKRMPSYKRGATLRNLTGQDRHEQSGTARSIESRVRSRTHGGSIGTAAYSRASITKRLLMQSMGSLVSFATSSTSASSSSALLHQQSPTCYADQLFQSREQQEHDMEYTTGILVSDCDDIGE